MSARRHKTQSPPAGRTSTRPSSRGIIRSLVRRRRFLQGSVATVGGVSAAAYIRPSLRFLGVPRRSAQRRTYAPVPPIILTLLSNLLFGQNVSEESPSSLHHPTSKRK